MEGREGEKHNCFYSKQDIHNNILKQRNLEYLVPLALSYLSEDICAPAYEEADILKAILKVDPEFWLRNRFYKNTLDNLIQSNRLKLLALGIDCRTF